MTEASLFAAALEKPAAERAVFLIEACNGDDKLRRRVEVLLKAHGESDELFEPAVSIRPTEAYRPIAEAPGTAIGPYKLRQKIGEGGFGVVFMAEQEKPVRRMVALKIIKPGMDTALVVARFESERQALALMDHPNIARVLDAGATESGRPYFVMELVKGVPITEFCDKNHLPPEQRLKLFVDVCHAIQHAHHKGVIHRDIKPSNVLVTLHDGVPVVKVIDFGVAKATVQKLTERTLFTAFGQMIGTPAYMSPEQAEMSGLDIDTRSDVYSLGVLLYELLTGTTPLESKQLREAGYAEIQRLIRDEEPQRPSTRLSSLGDSATVLAGNRGMDPKQLHRVVAGDLDWIVMKALEKDRNRRYATPGGFAEDVQRYLEHEPIAARPPAAAYRLKKFLRRNRTAVAAASTVFLTLVVGVAAVIVVQMNANRERAMVATEKAAREAGTSASVQAAIREAHERAEEAWKVLDFPDRMQIATDAALAAVRRADGFVASGTPTQDATAELAAARKEIDDLARHTQLVRTCIANQHRFADDVSTDVYKALRDLCVRQLEALRRFGLDPLTTPPDQVAAAVAASPICDLILGALLEVHEHTIEFAEDDPSSSAVRDAKTLEEVIRACRRRCGGAYARWQELLDHKDVPGLLAFAESPNALSFRSMLVGALGRDLDRTRQYQACLAFRRKAADRFPHDVFAQYDLHTTCRQVKPLEMLEALRHISEATSLRPDSPLFHLQLGSCYQSMQAYDRAVDCYRKSIALRPDYAIAYGYMGNALFDKKEIDQSLAAYREAVRVQPRSIAWRSVLAFRLEALGRTSEAAAVYREMLPFANEELEKSRKRVGPNHPSTRSLLRYLVVPLVKLGRIEEAMPSLEDYIRYEGTSGRTDLVQESVAGALAYFRLRREPTGCRRLAECWEQANATRPGWLYDAACWRAITAAAVKEAGRPDAAKQADAEADRAMGWLRKAVAGGFNDVRNMAKDTDLDFLRSRNDFKKLLADLEAREQTAKK